MTRDPVEYAELVTDAGTIDPLAWIDRSDSADYERDAEFCRQLEEERDAAIRAAEEAAERCGIRLINKALGLP